MWSTPDRVPHKHLWLWDTVFHSFAMNLFDPKLSRELLRAMLDTLWTAEDAAKAGQPEREGMMSHMCCVDGTRSHVTQPPILAWGVLENTKRLGVTADLAEILPTLEAYLEWDLAHRDRNRNGLLEWHMEGQVRCRCGESGLDNSPRFDSGEFLDAVDFSAFASHDMRCLAELLVMTGHTKRAALWRKRAEDMENDIQAMLWSEADGFYYDRTMDGQLTGVKAVSGFFPLLLPSVPADRAKRLAAMLNSTHFQARFPIPSVAATDREFSTDMWRGATWANTNYVALLGLERHGFKDEAAALREATIRMVQKHYEQSGVLFEFFDAADRVPPSACDRKGPPDGKPYLMGKVNSIRDYHWTAAVTACLLLSHTAGFPTNSGRQRIERP
ncbi:MAG: hypothetical protein FJ279_34275 [Planctomycetes bacterium]|nr:hypothetical protein [Planctomycetota bacterium]